jgi:4-carboxymuconolactone decarboxylase
MALLPYPKDEELDPRAKQVLDSLPVRINLFSMLANAPAMMGPTLELGRTILTEGEMDPALRELAILATAQHTGSHYEWVQHVTIAGYVGVSDAQIAAIEDGATAGPDFDDGETLVLDIVAVLATGGTPSEELVARGTEHLGVAVFLELLIVVGFYAMVGGLMRTVRLDEDAPLGGASADQAARMAAND